MKNQKRLSLDAFKEKANSVTNEEIMKNVQGGAWGDCHGFWGQAQKDLAKALLMPTPGVPFG